MDRDGRFEALNSLELITGGFNHTCIEICARSADQRRTQISTDEGLQPRVFANLAEQRRNGAFTIGAGHCYKWKIDKATGQLQFADYWNSLGTSFLQQD